jgi:hypothetical protein
VESQVLGREASVLLLEDLQEAVDQAAVETQVVLMVIREEVAPVGQAEPYIYENLTQWSQEIITQL